MKKIKILTLILVCLFAITPLVACNDDQANGGGNGGNGGLQSTIDISKAELKDTTAYYTGEPVAFTVKNLPGGVKVEYTYKLNGEEVTEMVEIGVYDVTAAIYDKATSELLTTLTAKLTIENKPVVDEVPNDANSNMELTYETTYVKFYKDPDDPSRLVAAGIELYAEETIYFVLDRDPSWTKENFPLEFLLLDSNSVACARLEGNALVISEQGTYDVIMSFPAGQLQPTILVRESKDSSIFYFRGSMNNYEIQEEYTFINEGNLAKFEADLEAGDVFIIGNYYYSVKFDYASTFMYYGEFAAGGATGSDVKVAVSGHYEFVVDMTAKTLTVTKSGQALEKDTNKLFLRGNLTNPAWDSLTLGLSKVNGIASIELDLSAGNTFKVANADWSTAYGYDYVSSSSNFGTDQDNNIVVNVAGTYKFEVDTNNNKVTVYCNGEKIVDAQGSTGGGNQGGNTGAANYGLVITHSDGTRTIVSLQHVDDFEGFSQHFGDNVSLQAGDVITLIDFYNGNAEWAEDNLSQWSTEGFTANANGITCTKSGTYDFYVKFKFEADEIYIGPAN